jgi:threonine dehydrogenase-like Zn-dependent dehydrogenase
VRVLLAGICATDLELARGYLGFTGVGGHEFVGEVRRSQTSGLIGRRVVGEINAPCGRCDTCTAGQPRHCPHRTVLGIAGRDGALAEFLTLPDDRLHVLPDHLSDEAAVFVEPVAAACRVLEQVGDERRALVLGDGRLGLLIAGVLAASELDVTVVGHHAQRAAIAHELGARWRPDAPGRWGLVVEATGREAGLAAALAAVRPLGTLVLKTTLAVPHRIDLAPLVIDEIRVIGSRCGPFEPAIELLASGRLDPTPLIQELFPLARAADALKRAGEPGVLKVLVRPGG